jgi:hypothetical protein
MAETYAAVLPTDLVKTTETNAAVLPTAVKDICRFKISIG